MPMKYPKFDNVAPLTTDGENVANRINRDEIAQTISAALQHIERLNDRILVELGRCHALQVVNAGLEGAQASQERERAGLLARIGSLEEHLEMAQSKRLALLEELTETRVILRSREGYIDRLENALTETRRKLRRARQTWLDRLIVGNEASE